jgi:electron transfer flavoprotein beta subunit
MILVCLKWTPRADLADVTPDPEWVDERFAGISPADRAALEIALRLGETRGVDVVAVAVGPHLAEAALRDALGVGVSRAIRVDLPLGAPSRDVAAELAGVATSVDASIVLCGDYSLDRGTGSVPAFVAHELDAAQALGLVSIETSTGDEVRAVRRLDGGRREVLRVPVRCVLSVEGSVAGLRRASLRAALASRDAAIEVIDGNEPHHGPAVQVSAYRPRARVLPPPSGDDPLLRLRSLTDTAAGPARGEIVHLEPPAAAKAILDRLHAWGYLPN